MSVDPEFARWLREGALYEPAENAAVAAAWGALAKETEIMSPLALKAGAAAEGARQVEFLGGPLAMDTHVVPGLRRDLLGRAVTIVSDRLGYEAGAAVFVIAYSEARQARTTTLTVLRKLA